MNKVRAKKYLGQHFLKDESIAKKIVDSLPATGIKNVLEIGPGMGVLTKFMLPKKEYLTTVVEIDIESVDYLKEHFPQLQDRIVSMNFLKWDLDEYFHEPFAIIGNLPYNISSQIFFRVLKFRNKIPQMVCMIQKEVAERISSPPGSKAYGILSVFLQSFYDIEYLFTVSPESFLPPPKVESGVIRLIRNKRKRLKCDEPFFFKVVKTAFNQRRKTMRNSLKTLITNEDFKKNEIFSRRPETLSVEEFEELTILLSKQEPKEQN